MVVRLDPIQTAAGVGLGVVADAVFNALGQPGGQWPPTRPLEHAHVGLAALILAEERPKLASVATGFGITLIIEDAVPGPWPGNYFGLYPNATTPAQDIPFTLGLYAIEVGILVARAYKH